MTRAAGIDVGGTKCLGVVIDADGEVVAQHRVPSSGQPGELLDAIVTVARALGEYTTLGVGLPGLVTLDGVVRSSPHLANVREFSAGTELARQLGHQVMVANDATCAAVAEWRVGAGQGTTDMVMVTLGTGIGGGLIQNGQVQLGANGFAGEIGHMTVQRHGLPCPCGRRGCWERYASGSGLAHLAGGRSGEEVIAACRAGDVDALAIIDEFADWIAIGLVNLTNLLDPEMFVIGGGLTGAADILAGPMERHLGARLYSPQHRPHPRLVFAQLGEEAGAIGAAMLARRS